MPRPLRRHVALPALLAIVAASASGAAARQAPAPQTRVSGTPLTVMSLKIRYGTAKDGDNAWPARRDMLFDLLRQEDADLVGLQEALDFQIDEIAAAVPAYAVVGVGRDDGADAGEFSAILFRRDRFRVAEAGTFWLSDTPSRPGSTSWGNTITRICTWARFIDQDGRGFYHYNLHLDHQSQPSREQSTLLLRARLATRAFPAAPVLVTGDFNAGERNAALLTLTAPRGSALLLDTFRMLHPDAADAGTFSGFTFGKSGPEKIDYVLVPPGTDVTRAEILRFSRDNRYPSDHFPVIARVALPYASR